MRSSSILRSLFIVANAIPWQSVLACPQPRWTPADPNKRTAMWSSEDTWGSAYGGSDIVVGVQWWGILRRAPLHYPEPVVVECDLSAASAIIEIKRMFELGANINGATTSGTGGNTPFAQRGSIVDNLIAGTIVVGYNDRGPSTTYHAFRWTTAGGATDLGTLDPPNNANRTSMATGVNTAGTVVVGFSQIGAGVTQHAFRWTASGMVDLGAPAGATRDSRALAVNGAGDVVVGDGVFVDPNSFTGFRSGAFRWTQAGGFQNLGALEPGFFSVATDVTADGAVIVGQGGTQVVVGNSSINGSRAFRWTSTAGLQAIGPMPGHTHAIATGVSDNGSVVVGTSSSNPLAYSLVLGHGNGTAFRWTQATGIQDLRQLLIADGLDLTGVTLLNATGVSSDGQWIFGNLTAPTIPSGETRAFVAKFCDAAIAGPCRPLIITPTTPTFNLTTTSSTLPSVVAGGTATSTLTVTPAGGFNQTVTFSCSGLPAESTCSFSPASVTPNATAASTTLTISTTAPRTTGFNVTFGLAALLLLAGWSAPRLRSPRLRPVAVGLSLVLLPSCGGGGDGGTEPPPPPTGGTPAGTYPIVVTATSGSGTTAVSKTVTISLTVTR